MLKSEGTQRCCNYLNDKMEAKSENRPPMARTVSLNLDHEDSGEGRDNEGEGNHRQNGKQGGDDDAKAGAARSRSKSLIKKQLTVQRITRAFKVRARFDRLFCTVQ